MNKVQLTLTQEEMNILLMKASSLGYDVTKYIKFLISKEAYSIMEHTPVYTLSRKMEKKVEKAMDEHKKGKSIELKNIDDLDALV